MLVRHCAFDRCLVTQTDWTIEAEIKHDLKQKYMFVFFLGIASSFKAGDTYNNQNALKEQISY